MSNQDNNDWNKPSSSPNSKTHVICTCRRIPVFKPPPMPNMKERACAKEVYFRSPHNSRLVQTPRISLTLLCQIEATTLATLVKRPLPSPSYSIPERGAHGGWHPHLRCDASPTTRAPPGAAKTPLPQVSLYSSRTADLHFLRNSPSTNALSQGSLCNSQLL